MLPSSTKPVDLVPKVYPKDTFDRHGPKLDQDFDSFLDDPAKLGCIKIVRTHQPVEHGFYVVNAYTQFDHDPKEGERLVEYGAVRSCFAKVKRAFAGWRIGYPKIGCGEAGGDWEVVKRIIDDELVDENHTVVMFEG